MALGSPLPPGVLEVPDQFLLLGIDRATGAPRRWKPAPAGDVLELGVSIGVLRDLPASCVSLQAVAGCVEQLTDQLRTDLMPLGLELGGEAPHTLAGPAQGRLGIAASG